MSEKEIISKVPKLTEEQIAANRAFQAELRKQFSLRKPSTGDYAAKVLAHNLNQITALTLELENRNDEDLKIRMETLTRDTMVWAESIGEFELARHLATATPDIERMNAYREAQDRPDDEWCGHPKITYKDGRPEQSAIVEFEFYSARHGKRVAMQKCCICGFRLALPNTNAGHRRMRH